MKLISDEYKRLLEKTHREDKKWGRDGHCWAGLVGYYACKYRAQMILDYGCGKGTLKATLGPVFDAELITCYEYDPGIPEKNNWPQGDIRYADMVVSTDVLEHIEPDCVIDTLYHMKMIFRKVVFLTISTRPANKILPDGRNVHLTLMSKEAWMDQLRKVFQDCNFHCFNIKKKHHLTILIVRKGVR